MYGDEKRYIEGFLWKNLKERDHLGDPRVPRRIILKSLPSSSSTIMELCNLLTRCNLSQGNIKINLKKAVLVHGLNCFWLRIGIGGELL
jgi:hypothetical protein